MFLLNSADDIWYILFNIVHKCIKFIISFKLKCDPSFSLSVPEKEKIYSRQVSAPILKRKTSRFGLGQFLSSGANNASATSYSCATVSHQSSQPHTSIRSGGGQTQQHHYYFHFPHSSTSTSISHLRQLCPIHQHIQHYHHHHYPHSSSNAPPVATTSTLASTHSQSHQYLVQCVPSSQMQPPLSPMPTLQEAESKSPLPSHSHQHSHFQKHPSAPNLFPTSNIATAANAPPNTPAASSTLHCTCDVGCGSSSTAPAAAAQGRF